MYRASSLPFFALLLVLFMGTTGCEENTVGPSGDGKLLEAEIDGAKQSFSLNVLATSYLVDLKTGQFRGSVAGAPTRSLTIIVRTDLDAGTFPRTLEDPEASFQMYEVINGTDTTNFTSSDPSGSSTLTISSKSTTATGSILISGTFSGVLKGVDNPSLTRTITNGKFSVDLSRF